MGGIMGRCRALLPLGAGAFIVAVLITGCFSAPASSPEPTPTIGADPNPCSTAYALLTSGLLTEAESEYTALLTPSQGKSVPQCAVPGLQNVAKAREDAARLASFGERAATEGNLAVARKYYTEALNEDSGNQAAESGLQTLDQQRPNGIRQARDYWNQVVDNTLAPLGQLFLWLLAVGVGIYILYLLARVTARLPLPERPSQQGLMKILARSFFGIALLAAIVAAAIGLTGGPHGGPAGRWWLGFLVAAGLLVVAGCVLMGWCLRSGMRIQATVTNEEGSQDNAARAFLVGRLDALGAKPPRGFDLPQDTDVTSLTDVVTLLPGGGFLSALVSFLTANGPVTPWQAAITLIDQDQLLVTLHRNRRLIVTCLANRAALFFPASASANVTAIGENEMLTIAAAIILVTMAMAEKDSQLRAGLCGATRWESVAGQVLATQQGLGGSDDLSQALLDRAVDIDPGNLAAREAKIAMSGRRASDPAGRREFANQISRLAGINWEDPGNRPLQLRVFYSDAAGWCNVYLDSRAGQPRPSENKLVEDWEEARLRTTALVKILGKMADGENVSRNTSNSSPDTITAYMKTAAYALWMGLKEARPRGAAWTGEDEQTDEAVKGWRPTGRLTTRTSYDEACMEAVEGNYDKALDFLKLAVADKGLRMWARLDPSFEILREDSSAKVEFLDIVADPPPESFINLKPLSSHAGQLSDIGVETARDLRNLTAGDDEVQQCARAVGVPPLVVQRWHNISILGTLSPDGPDLAQLDLLLAADVDSVAKLQAQVDTDIDELHKRLEDEAADRQVTIPSQDDLRRWSSLAPSPPGRGQPASGPVSR